MNPVCSFWIDCDTVDDVYNDEPNIADSIPTSSMTSSQDELTDTFTQMTEATSISNQGNIKIEKHCSSRSTYSTYPLSDN